MNAEELIETLFVITGCTVWAKVLTRYLYGKNYIKINVSPERIMISSSSILIILLTFFALSGTIIQLSKSLNITFHINGTEEIRFARQLISDICTKVIISTIIICVFLKKIGKFSGNRLLKDLIRAGAIYFASFPLVNVICVLLSSYFLFDLLGVNIYVEHPAIRFLESEVPITLKFIAILLAVIVSPLAEELFFRGMIQNYIYTKLQKVWTSIITTAFIFSLVHLPLYNHLLPLFVLGVIIGWSYYRYQSLLVPIFTHIFFNLGTIILWVSRS